MNSKTNCIHERAPRLVYSDHSPNCDESLIKDGLFSIYDRNLQTLAIEISKFFHGYSSSIMENNFLCNTKNPYSLRSLNKLYCRNPTTVKYETETISYLAPKI